MITGILLKNIEDKNLIVNFFKRRFSRIFPILSFSVLVSLIFSYFIFLPSEIIRLANSAISSLTFLSNIFFWKYLNSYNHDEAILNTLLHTWSLSVEIQFYLIFPLLFIIFKSNKIYLRKVIFSLGIISFIFANLGSYYEPNVNFFGLHSRFFEFAYGSIFFLIFKNKKFNLKYFNKQIIYLFIFFICIFFKDSYLHPSLLTLLILIVVSTLMLNKSVKLNLFDKILTFFGKISYSLYIWHFIIFSFFIRIGSLNNIQFATLGLLFSIFLSLISFYLFENKLRKKFKSSLYFFTICSILSLILCFYIISNKGYPERLNKVKFKINEINVEANIKKNFEVTFKNFQKYDSKNIIILGNSHSVHTYKGFYFNKDLYPGYNFSNFHIQVSCILDALRYNKDYCKGLLDISEKKKFRSGMNDLSNSNIVILSTRWTNLDLKQLNSVIEKLKKMKKKVIIFDNIYDIKKSKIFLKNKKYNFLEKYFLSKQFYYERFLGIFKKIPDKFENLVLEKKYFENIDISRKVISEELKKIAKMNNIEILNLNKSLCNIPQKRCLYKTENEEPIYLDDTGHLTNYGDAYVFKTLSKEINLIFQNYAK